jgi:hypothetical protein
LIFKIRKTGNERILTKSKNYLTLVEVHQAIEVSEFEDHYKSQGEIMTARIRFELRI